MHEETVWSFETEQFQVELRISEEDLAPEDSFEFQEDIDAVRNGDVAWFCARVVVTKNEKEIGSDALGGCAYKNVSDFYTSHRDSNPMNRNCSLMRAVKGSNVVICDYFPSMVRCAIADARRTLGTTKWGNLDKAS